MSNNIFPALPLLGLDVTVKPTYATRTLESVSGKEVRVAWRAGARMVYEISFDAVRTTTRGRADYTPSTGAWTYNPAGAWTEQSVIRDFIDTHKGSWDSFLFPDPIVGGNVRVRFVEDSIVFRKVASGFWEVESFSLIQVL